MEREKAVTFPVMVKLVGLCVSITISPTGEELKALAIPTAPETNMVPPVRSVKLPGPLMSPVNVKAPELAAVRIWVPDPNPTEPI